MNLNYLLANLLQSRDLTKLFDRLDAGERLTAVTDLPVPGRPPVIAAAALRRQAPMVVVASRFDRAEALLSAMNEYLPLERQAELWPAPEALPYEQLPLDLTAATRRVALLARLLDPNAGAAPIVVTTPRGLMHIVMSPADLRTRSRTVRLGGRVSANDLIGWAAAAGYQSAPLVQDPGSFARRGGIIDIFPPAADFPIRIDLFGDDVESIRTFNPSTQRSDRRLSTVTLLPTFDLPAWRMPEAAAEVARLNRRKLRTEVDAEWGRTIERLELGVAPPSIELFSGYLAPERSSLMTFLPANALIVLDEPAAIDRAAAQIESYAAELLDGFVASGELPAGLKKPYLAWTDLRAAIDKHALFDLGSSDEQTAPDDDVVFAQAPIYAGRTAALIEDVRERLSTGWSVAIASDQVDRLTEIFEENSVYPRKQKRGQESTETRCRPPRSRSRRPTSAKAGWSNPSSCWCCPTLRSSDSASKPGAELRNRSPNTWPSPQV